MVSSDVSFPIFRGKSQRPNIGTTRINESVRPEGTTRDESYIGDGVHADFDGYAITLKTERHGDSQWIVLEPEVYSALVRFAEHINGKYNVKHFK